MQNQYAGDVGDFGKYGLLRFLCPQPVKLGVVWCLYPDETDRNDGRHIDYLKRDDFRRCDPTLFDDMKSMVDAQRRSIAEVQRRSILPGVVYFDELLRFDRPRVVARTAWLDRALHATRACDAVFFDPDNGLEINSCNRAGQIAGKFIYLDELEPFIARKQTAIVYHHLCRRGSHDDQIRERRRQLEKLHPAAVYALRFRRYSARAYFILATDAASHALRGRLDRFVDTPWGQHFELA